MLKTFADNSKRYETQRSFPPWPTALCFVKITTRKWRKNTRALDTVDRKIKIVEDSKDSCSREIVEV
jgi:hypothetical protein